MSSIAEIALQHANGALGADEAVKRLVEEHTSVELAGFIVKRSEADLEQQALRMLWHTAHPAVRIVDAEDNVVAYGRELKCGAWLYTDLEMSEMIMSNDILSAEELGGRKYID